MTILKESSVPAQGQFPRIASKQPASQGFLSLFVKGSWAVLTIAAILQLLLFWSYNNLVATACIVVAWALVSVTLLKKSVLNRFPLSTFLILGYALTQFYLPLIATLLEKKPVVYNLEMAREVFLHSMLALLVLLGTHMIYRTKFPGAAEKGADVLSRIGFFKPPSHLQLWLVGWLGVAATCYSFIFTRAGTEQTGSALDKLIQSLIPFTYAPFFIPFGELFGGERKFTRRQGTSLLIFTIVLFAVSIGRNSRGAFMFGFTSVGFAFCLGLLMEIIKTKLFTARNVLIGLLCFWLFTGPISDLGTAMVVVRGKRSDVSSSELIKMTLETYQDKKALAEANSSIEKGEIDWDEDYLNNIFLARFCNLKFNDASLVDAAKLGHGNPEMRHFTTDRLWAMLPDPMLKLFNIEVNKTEINAMSFGDYLHYLAGADTEAIGRFVTGHFSGTGMAAFGWWYLLILAIGMLPVYFICDVFFTRRFPFNKLKRKLAGSVSCFSFCGLLALTSTFLFLPSESVLVTGNLLIRGFLQMILLYFLVFKMSEMGANVITSFQPRIRASAARNEQ